MIPKQYKQSWLKIDSHPLKSSVTVTYSWDKDKFNTGFVFNIIGDVGSEQLYDYATVHPEQFDPNEIEQLKMLSLKQKKISQESTSDEGDLD